MSHFEVNKRKIRKIMSDKSLTDSQKDEKLAIFFLGKEIKGGKDMLNQTREWIKEEYSDIACTLVLLWELEL